MKWLDTIVQYAVERIVRAQGAGGPFIRATDDENIHEFINLRQVVRVERDGAGESRVFDANDFELGTVFDEDLERALFGTARAD